MILFASCDACGETVEVDALRLFEFDCSCSACGGLLVLEEEADADLGPDEYDEYPDDGEEAFLEDDFPPRDSFYDPPTKADTEDLPEGDRPTRADVEDPYELAARALDSTILGVYAQQLRSIRHPEGAEELDARLITDAVSTLLGGTQADAPPLPSWDGGDTQQVHALAQSEPPPLEGLIPLPVELDPYPNAMSSASSEADTEEDLDALVEVVEVSTGTKGRGSRTYEREEMVGDEPVQAPHRNGGAGAQNGDPQPDLEARAAALTLRQSGPDPDHAAPGPSALNGRAHPASSAPDHEGHAQEPIDELSSPPHAEDDEPGSDLDWLALIDDALPEDGDDSEDSKPRVVIRLPPDTAPLDANDAEQVRRFHSTVASLETGGPAALESLIASGLIGDRPAQRYPEQGGVETPPAGTPLPPEEETRSWQVPPEERGRRDEPTDDPGEATQIRAPQSSPSQRVPRSAMGTSAIETPSFEAAHAADVQPDEATSGSRAGARLSGRVGRSARGRVIEEFRRSDLDPGLVCAREVGSVEADTFRQLYQRIFHAQNGSSPRVVLVTSARPGEGKTTVAANLAIVAARNAAGGGLLVDANPRDTRGGVLRVFGQRSPMEGLLEALQTGKDPLDYVVQFNMGTLDVVPLGIPGSDAAELVGSDRTHEVLTTLRHAYPTGNVLVDGSSVLRSADPLVLARAVDGVVFVVRAGRTPRAEVRRAMELIGPERILGVVLNDTRE